MKVAVIDDEALIALDIAGMIEALGHEVVGPFSSIEEVMRLTPEHAPDVALVDLRLGNRRCGARIDAYMHEAFGTVSAYVTGNADFAYRYRTKAVGFITKPVSEAAIAEVVAYLGDIRYGRVPTKAPRNLALFEKQAPFSPGFGDRVSALDPDFRRESVHQEGRA